MRCVCLSVVYGAVLLTGLAAGPAQADDGAPPRPTTVITQPKPQAPTKPKAAPQISLLRPSLTTSRYASPVDQAAQCRTQCAVTHLVCAVDDAGPGGQCENNWSRCTVACSGAGYPFHSSAVRPSN